MRGGIGGTTPGYEETYRRDAASEWQRSWQAERNEATPKSRAGSQDTWRRSQAATKKIVRQIYDAGEAVSQAGLGWHLGISARVAGKKVAEAIAAGLVENTGSTCGPVGQALRITTRGGHYWETRVDCMTWAKITSKQATRGHHPQSGQGQNHQREELTMYQHDTELTGRFAGKPMT
jgi:hypothetical protein